MYRAVWLYACMQVASVFMMAMLYSVFIAMTTQCVCGYGHYMT